MNMMVMFIDSMVALLVVVIGVTLSHLLNANKIKILTTKIEENSRFSDDLFRKVSAETQQKLFENLTNSTIYQQRTLTDLKETLQQALHQHRAQFDEHQLKSLKTLQESLQTTMAHIREEISKRVDSLTQSTDQRLKEISGQVEKRLTAGFEKTTEVFTDVIKRLALIDEAQKKITELSTNVVGLQEILNDKRSRGAFGEIQLAGLIRNMLPESHFALQHTLKNGLRADCILFLPKPTGNIVIDAKFPLESYRFMTDQSLAATERQAATQQFKQDIKKHIQDIASKYIIPEETSDGAVMFIPAEAVFAEIHAHFPELNELAQHMHVWLVSPTTMMAILTTARAVLKDEATRQQVHIIREHLIMLSKDFSRFEERMDNLAKHVRLAHEDAEDVNKSAKKIASRFNKIEKVELQSVPVISTTPPVEEKFPATADE
ncbi:MAG: recombinase RmuC [Gammaproteobacteria bacterium RIFCSPHIGHO2_02_FULL_42_13]|nr:MAG: recombinase RmuC [Gammaproteobacteria bacterium RIFCSPHIGHO2_02_FULL_42_13]